jgi:signal transduction histidine kinase
MQWLAGEMQRTYGLHVKLACDQTMPMIESLNGAIYRTVRELLINVWKHADVDSADVSIQLNELQDSVDITVTDKGQGFDVIEMQKPSSKLSFGIYSIRERMHLIGGSVLIESEPGQGTQVRIQIPVRTASS